MWEHGARRRELEEGTQMDTRQLRRQRKDNKEGNMETVTGDETRRERDQTQTRLGKDRGHGRLSQETQERDRAQKTDTNKLNSIKKLNSRLN